MAHPRSGWRQSVLFFSIGAFLSFILNLAFTAWAAAGPGLDEASTGVLVETSCSRVRVLNIGLHVVINAIGSLLLAGSNYCMQCLSAPTRDQVNSAHAEKKWLDIGVPSVRNLGSISWRNQILWGLLSLSSIPLHLFYNSAIFASRSANAYGVFVVDEPWLKGVQPSPDDYTWVSDFGMENLRKEYADGLFSRLEVPQCIDAYGVSFQSAWGDVMLVADDSPRDPRPRGSMGNQFPARAYTTSCGWKESFDWMCEQYGAKDGSCGPKCALQLDLIRSNASSWQPSGLDVQYCYARQTREHCRLEFSLVFCVIATTMNLAKTVLMLLVMFGREEPLLTVGDAIASFLRFPDNFTADMCLASRRDFTSNSGDGWSTSPRQFEDKRRWKFSAATARRWVICNTLYLVALLVCAFVLGYGLNRMRVPDGSEQTESFLSLAGLGLAPLAARTLLSTSVTSSDPTALMGNIVLANSPQLILSLLYFTFNGLFTSLSMGTEWSSLAQIRKGLRVSSNPTSAQRKTHFLQLPYRFSIPLIIFSCALHWLISQSIFLVKIQNFDSNGQLIGPPVLASDKYGGFVTCGWSPLGVVCTILLGSFLLIFLVLSGFRRLPTGMPVAGSCSAAIAAACHTIPLEPGSWMQPLQWGVKQKGNVDHCSFSGDVVQYPEKGRYYT